MAHVDSICSAQLAMKIGINCLDFTPGRMGGMGHYFLRLLSELHRQEPRLEFLLFATSRNSASLEKIGIGKIQLVPSRFIGSYIRKKIAEEKVDVYFCPFFSLYPTDPGVPSCVMIPDAQQEEHPDFFTRYTYIRRKIETYLSLKLSDCVFTLSQHSKNVLLRICPIPQNKIQVTALDSALSFTQMPEAAHLQKKYHLPKEFYVYPAIAWPHKNHDRLLEALLFLSKEARPISCVFTSGSEEKNTLLRQKIQAKNLTNHAFVLDCLTEEELAALYKISRGLIFPSLYEGFGMPLVEAMRAGIPIAAARATSIPEIVQEAALLFNPYSVEEIAQAIKKLEQENILRENLIQKGNVQEKLFSWQKNAEITFSAIQTIAKKLEKKPYFLLLLGKLYETGLDCLRHIKK